MPSDSDTGGAIAGGAPAAGPSAGTSHAAVFALLGAGTLVCLGLVAGRMLYSHTSHFHFLVWNLFLAWIPLVLAALAYRTALRRGKLARVALVVTALVWLLFFPNAPYIVTDFVHFGEYHDSVPSWFDVILIAWFAWTGLLLGIVSLRLMQEIVARARGVRAGWLLAVAATLLGSFGIYLGRFLRWNSWNVFQSPFRLFDKGLDTTGRPDIGELMLGFTFLFALLFLFVYTTTFLLAPPRDDPAGTTPGREP